VILFFSTLCSHCASVVRQRVSKCHAVALRRNNSLPVQCWSVSYRRSYAFRSMSTSQTVTQGKGYSSLPLKLQSQCVLLHHWRPFSTTSVAGGMFRRLLKLRYILLTGAVGGGITLQQVTSVPYLTLRLYILSNLISN